MLKTKLSVSFIDSHCLYGFFRSSYNFELFFNFRLFWELQGSGWFLPYFFLRRTAKGAGLGCSRVTFKVVENYYVSAAVFEESFRLHFID